MTALLPFGRLIARALRSRWGRLDGPFKLTVAVTGRCNARCATCGIGAGAGAGAATDELTTAELDRLLCSCGRGLIWLDLTGGEPFLREDIVEVCGVALRRCPNLLMLHLPTNGLDPDRVERVCREVVRRNRPHRLVVSVSLFGPPQLNDRLRRVRDGGRGVSAFALACDTLRRLAAAGIEAYPGVTLCRHNEDQLQQTAAAIAERVPGFRPEDLHLNLFHESEYYGRPGDQTPTVAALERAVTRRRPRSAFALAELAYLTLGLTYLARRTSSRLRGDQISPIPCSALQGSAYVAPDGALFPCVPWSRELGKLRDHHLSLPRLWHGPAASEALDAYRRHQCPGCWTPCEAYQALLARPEWLVEATRRFLCQRLVHPRPEPQHGERGGGARRRAVT